MLHNKVVHGLYPNTLCRCWPAHSAIFRGHEVTSVAVGRKISLSVPLMLILSVINWLTNLNNWRNVEAFNCFLDVSYCISGISKYLKCKFFHLSANSTSLLLLLVFMGFFRFQIRKDFTTPDYCFDSPLCRHVLRFSSELNQVNLISLLLFFHISTHPKKTGILNFFLACD